MEQDNGDGAWAEYQNGVGMESGIDFLDGLQRIQKAAENISEYCKTLESTVASQQAKIDELNNVLTTIANLSHHGGLMNKSVQDVQSEIRRITLPYWNKEECSTMQLDRLIKE